MRKALFLLFTLFALTISATATDVTVASSTVPNFNPTNIGNDFQQAATVSVTNGSPTVTSSAAFTAWVGMVNFPIRINDVAYTALSVTNANTLVLSINYTGLTATNARLTRGMVVSVTNGSATVTNYEQLFRNYVGLSGFTVTIEGVNYTVASVTDSQTLTLTANYSGSTDAYAGMSWYKYIEVRVYSSVSFRPLGKDYVVTAGSPGSSAWYKRFAASVITVSGVSTLYIPEFVLDSTTDAPGNNTARYTFTYNRPDGSEIDKFRCSSTVQLAIPPTTPTTLADICSYNSAAILVPDNSSYTRGEIDRRFPSCTTNQLIYYAATGNRQTCLSIDSSLTISGGTLSVAGGGSLTGTGTTNRIPVFTSGSSIGNSILAQTGTSAIGFSATGKRLNLDTGSQIVIEVANEGSTGTTNDRLAKLTGAPSTAVIVGTSDTTGVVGIVVANGGTTGNAQIAIAGIYNCEFDGATTAGNYVIPSTGTAGKCADGGSSVTAAKQVIGRVLTTNGSAGTYSVLLFGAGRAASVAGSGTTNYVALWSGANTLTTATDFFRDGATPEYVFQDDVHINTTAASSKLRIDTDQIVLEGSATRSNSAVMQTMKATASQSGNFQTFTTSGGSTVFAVDIDGDVRPRGVNYAWPAANASGVLTNNGSGTLSWASAGVSGVMQATNAVLDYSCDPASGTDDTTCLNNALTAAIASTGKTLYLPAGTYETTGITTSTNSLRIIGDGPGKTILKVYSGSGALLTFDNSSVTTHSITIEHLSLEGLGGGTANNGLVISGANERFNFTLNNVRMREFGGTTLLSSGGALFTSRFVDLDIDQPSAATGHAIDINGAQTNVFERIYVHNVATNKAAYRFRQGAFTCIACNGIDSGTTANWGIMGQETASDGTDTYVQLTMIGSNVEDWSATDGIIFRTGSIGSFYNTKFDTLSTGTYRAIKFNYVDVGFSGIFDAESGFLLNGSAAWTNSLPVHSYNPPFIQIGSNEISSYYDTNLAASVTLPAIKNSLNTGQTRAAIDINRLTMGTSAGQGFDSSVMFGTDNTYDVGTSSGQRPRSVYVGTSITMATGTTTVGGQNWTITGGASPLYAFDDGTVAGRVQLATGSHMQVGTTSAHSLKLLSNGTARWNVNSSGHFIVDSGSLTIGLAAGNRPTIGYFSTSVNVGIPGTGVGSIVFGNGTNSNTFTLQSGTTGSSLTFTLPTADGSSGHCLKTNGSGVLSFASCSSTPSLTATYVGYGDGSNLLTGTTDFTYSTSTKTLTITNGSGASTIALTGTSDTNAVTFGAGSRPGSQGGLIMPFVGGSNSSGPGIWWASSASYAAMSGIYLNNGFTFQGANSTHDNVKIAEGTGTSSNGTVRYTFAPSSSLFTQTLSTSVTNVNHDYSIIDLSSTGTAAANFGAGMLVKLENGSSTQVDASRIRTYWTTATAGSETSAVAIGIQKAGGGVADVLTVTGDQYYGIRYTANITGAATIDLNNGNSQELTLTGNVTATTLSNIKAGGIYFIIFKQDGTGSRSLASTNIKAPGGSLTLTATAGARDLFVCTSDGTNLYCNKALDVR